MNFDKYLQLIEKSINNYNKNSQPKELYDPINYMLNIGGKRLRPIIVLMTCDIFEGNMNLAINPALAVECFHNFSLIHDDIMDKATLRRGKETVHIKYNNNTAILSGDALLVSSYQLFEELESDLFKKSIKTFSDTALRVCEGQQYDMNFETLKEISFNDYINMVTGKTAVLCAYSFQLGAFIADSDLEDSENIYQFGLYLGLAYQFKDDYLDVFGNKDLVGKISSGDIYENKKTILYVLAMQNANENQKEELLKWFDVQTESIEKINSVVSIFKDLEVDKLTEQLIEDYNNKASEYLNKVKLSEDKKQTFYQLMEYLLKREY